jgi:hypothetical protein
MITYEYAPAIQSDLCSVGDIAALAVPGVPRLLDLEQAYGHDLAVLWLCGQIGQVNGFVGARTKLNDSQTAMLAETMLSTVAGLNLLEVAHFFSRLTAGVYDSFYGSVDPQKILHSLSLFMDDRRKDLARAWMESEHERRIAEREAADKESVTLEKFLKGHEGEEDYQFLRNVMEEIRRGRGEGTRSMKQILGNGKE